MQLTIEGQDGFNLKGESSLKLISRDVLDLVQQTYNKNHQYPGKVVVVDVLNKKMGLSCLPEQCSLRQPIEIKKEKDLLTNLWTK